MARAKQFQHLGPLAVNVLARQAARKAVKEHLRAQGIRLTYVPHRQIVRQTKAHLEAHPELYEQALQRAWEMGVCRPVPQSDNAKSAPDNIDVLAQPKGDLTVA
jgi:hypothetical protein